MGGVESFLQITYGKKSQRKHGENTPLWVKYKMLEKKKNSNKVPDQEKSFPLHELEAFLCSGLKDEFLLQSLCLLNRIQIKMLPMPSVLCYLLASLCQRPDHSLPSNFSQQCLQFSSESGTVWPPNKHVTLFRPNLGIHFYHWQSTHVQQKAPQWEWGWNGSSYTACSNHNNWASKPYDSQGLFNTELALTRNHDRQVIYVGDENWGQLELTEYSQASLLRPWQRLQAWLSDPSKDKRALGPSRQLRVVIWASNSRSFVQRTVSIIKRMDDVCIDHLWPHLQFFGFRTICSISITCFLVRWGRKCGK